MNKLKSLLIKLLFRVSNLLLSIAYKLQPPVVTDVTEDDLKAFDNELDELFPHSFTTFKEGMTSTNYCKRHDAAASLVGWYINEQGTPYIGDITRAAEILLEDTNGTSADISLLLDAWHAQASAKTDQEKEDALRTEHDILNRVAIKVKQ